MISPAEISHLKSKDEAERFIRDNYQNDPEKLVSDINAAVNNLLQSDLNQARRLVDSLRKFSKYLPNYHKPRLLAVEARYAHRAGESKKALRKYILAIERLQAARNFDGAARARQGLMDVYMYLGRYEKALDVGRRALRYFRRKGNKAHTARVTTNMGNIYHRLDRNKLALRYYERARKIFESTGGVPLAILDFNLANIYTNLNQLGRAEVLYKSASRIFSRNNMTLAEGKANYSLAYLYFLADRYTTALTAFERVLSVFQELGDTRAVAVTRLDLAEINAHLNQFGTTINMGTQALEACDALNLHYEKGKAAYFIAEGYRRLGDYLQASRYLKQSESLFSRESNYLWQGMVNLARCRIKTASNRYNEALTAADSARRMFKISGDERRSNDADITVAEIHLAAGREKQAMGLVRRLLRRKLVSYQQHILYDLMGVIYLRRGQPKMALEYFKRAIEIIENTLVNIYPDEIRFFFALDKYPTYLSAVSCLLQINRVEDSFLQHSRALAVLNQRRMPDNVLNEEVPHHLLDARAGLRASLKKFNLAPDPDKRRISGMARIYREEHRLWDIERRIRSYKYPASRRYQLPEKAGPAYSKLIGSRDALISFAYTSPGVGAFCVHHGEIRYIDGLSERNCLETTIRELHFLMERAVNAPSKIASSKEAIDNYLKRLYDHLIKPLRLPVDIQRLIFILDGPVAQIPFPALTDASGRWLKDKYDLRMIANPDDLRTDRNRTHFSGNIRNAIFAPASVGLPLVEIEGHKVKKTFRRARLYTGQKANIQNLQYELSRAEGFVHIATHASRSSENPLFSRLLMADGPFFPFDLFGTGIKARLVTLSGCQTAAPGIYYGNSFSLAKAFYHGGADYVLASLWPISDKVSIVFMTEFYKALKVNEDILAAYHVAMDKTRSVNDNPAFSAPFVMLGI